MSDSKRMKKIEKENKQLKKSVNDLVVQQKDLLRTLKKLAKAKKGKKRKRSEEKREESRKKKKKTDEGLSSLQGDPQGSRKNDSRLKIPRVKVSNTFAVPGQKKGQNLFISDGSPENNRQIYRWVEKYQKLPVGKEKTRVKRNLVAMFKEAISKGHVIYDTKYVPEDILRPAMEEYQKETGKEVTMEFDSSPSATTSESEGPPPKERFTGNMEKYVIDLTQKDNNGFVENLANTTDQVSDILMRLLRRWKSFKYYVEYAVILERDAGPGANEDFEQRDVKLTSSGEDSIVETVRKKADVDQTLSASFQRLLEALTRYTGQGSGLRFLESISLSILASRQVFGITKSLPESETTTSTSSSNEDIESGDAGGTWIPLPPWVRNRRAAVNPKPPGNQWRTDQRCFEWAILRGLNYPLDDPLQRPMDISDLLPKRGSIALPEGVSYPIPLDDRVLSEIENLNGGFSFSIFSLGNVEDECRPLYISRYRFQRGKHIQLGLISSFGKSHFVMIRGMSTLFPNSYNGSARFFCEACLSPHKTRQSLKNHEEACGKHEPAKIVMPEKGSKDHVIRFESWRFKLPKPWVIYADFESVIDAKTNRHTVSSAVYSINCRYEAHEKVLGFGDRPLGELRKFAGPSTLSSFMSAVFEDVSIIEGLSTENKPCDPSEEELRDFKETKECHICQKPLGPVRDMDHDHYDGRYRGAAHKSCNMQYGASKYFKVPVVFHNLRGYDGYFVLRELANMAEKLEKVEVIAKNLDKYTCIEVNNVRFMDSMQFINGKLETLVENYRKDMEDEDPIRYQSKLVCGFPKIWDFVRKRFESFPKGIKRKGETMSAPSGGTMKDAILASMLRMSVTKGVYPYEYMDSFERMKETSLPPRSCFFSKLKNEGISEADYWKANRVWQTFRCKDMLDYTQIYNTLDVLLLEVLFETFRASCLAPDSYGLDPAHFITAPSLSWYAMLKMNFRDDITIENMTDVNMLLMVESGVMGGICQVFNPFASLKAATREELFEINDGFDRKIVALDANNLYGWAMSQPLPIGCFRWEKVGEGEVLQRQNPKDWIPLSELAKKQLAKGKEAPEKGDDPNMSTVELWANEDMGEVREGILKLDPLGAWGYILEVDVNVPERLHDLLNDYPLLPEHKCPLPSPFSQAELDRLGMDGIDETTKLVCDLTPKRNYVIHFRNLIQALELGYKLIKIHRVIAFKQRPWLATYIQFNTDKRRVAKNSVEKDFFKLMNNSIFGKMLEQVRKRRNIRFYLEKDILKALRQASGPWAKQWRVIVEDKLVIMELAKHKVVMNRPVILGMSILGLSKWLMYDFHYNKMLPTFGLEGLTLNYTDTDSLIYLLKAPSHRKVDDMLIEMQEVFDCFDLSELDKENALIACGKFDPKKNAKIPGLFKDDTGGRTIKQFAGVRSKMYSLKMEKGHGKDKSKKKGIPESAFIEVPCEGIGPSHRRTLKHSDYVRAIFGESSADVHFATIEHDKQFNVRSDPKRKKGLAGGDTKSYYFDHASCVRYGHKHIKDVANLFGSMEDYYWEQPEVLKDAENDVLFYLDQERLLLEENMRQ